MSGQLFDQYTMVAPLSREWQTFRFTKDIPANAKEAVVRIEVQYSDGEVLFDNLNVDYATDEVSNPANVSPPVKKEGFKFRLPF